MKKIISVLLCVLMLCSFVTPVMAHTEPVITRQPQNPTYGVGAVAGYSVTVYGENLRCYWVLNYNGVDYYLSDAGSGQPWEAYAGEAYGPSETTDGLFTTFSYYFTGIGEGLSGSYIYAIIEDGHYQIESDKAYISLSDQCGAPPTTSVPASMEVYQGETLDLYCYATTPDGAALSYLWYETGTGDLIDIIAINRGSEDRDTLSVDTSECGTRYYVCGVDSASGGSAYTSVIPVTVLERPQTHTVSFEIQQNVEFETVEHGETVTQPDDPEIDGYMFLGWYTEEGELFDFSTPITDDIYLTARFDEVTVYYVAYCFGPNDPVGWQGVVAGEKAEEPEPPAQEGKIFLGWYTEYEGGELFDFNTPITEDINIYARFVDESLRGDLNGDGKVNARDKALLTSYIKEGKAPDIADLNGDGKVNARDKAEITAIIKG